MSCKFGRSSSVPSSPIKIPTQATTRRLSNVTDKRNKLIETTAIPEHITTVVDNSIPDMIPKDKAMFTLKWDWKHKGSLNEFDFGKVNIRSCISQNVWSESVLNHTEIHVLWTPHLPVNSFINTSISVGLKFTPSGEENNLLSECIFPSPLHAHMIFYPGHSCSISIGKRLPWSLSLKMDGHDIADDYKVADVFIKLIGYNSLISTHTKKSGADLISMVPIDEEFQGITLSRPRISGDNWVVGNYKTGIKASKDAELLMKLSKFGVDIEGLQILGKLPKMLKTFGHVKLIDDDETKRTVLETAINIIRSK